MYISRPDFINIIAEDAGVSPHQAENTMNAIFGHFKKLLRKETIEAIAKDIESGDLRGVWLTSQLAEKETIVPKPGSTRAKGAKWH